MKNKTKLFSVPNFVKKSEERKPQMFAFQTICSRYFVVPACRKKSAINFNPLTTLLTIFMRNKYIIAFTIQSILYLRQRVLAPLFQNE